MENITTIEEFGRIQLRPEGKIYENLSPMEADQRLRFRPGVAVFVFNERGHILLGQRKSDKHDDGSWCLPGGGLDWGEAIDDASVRETLEETGLEVTYVGQICSQTYYNAEHDSYHLTIYTVAKMQPGDEPFVAEPHKCYEWLWFPIDQLPTPLAFPCTAMAAARLQNVGQTELFEGVWK